MYYVSYHFEAYDNQGNKRREFDGIVYDGLINYDSFRDLSKAITENIEGKWTWLQLVDFSVIAFSKMDD